MLGRPDILVRGGTAGSVYARMLQDGYCKDALMSLTAHHLVGKTSPSVEPEFEYPAHLEFGDVLTILRRRYLMIAAIIGAFLALAIIYLLVATPYYTASTEILIDPRKKNTVETEVLPSGLGVTASDNFALVDSQVKVLMSDAVLRPVVDSQDLAADPEFNGKDRGIGAIVFGSLSRLLSSSASGVPASLDETALKSLRNAIAVERDDKTYVIKIDVTTKSPTKSADIARAIATSYLNDQSEERIGTTQRVSSQMDGQLAALRDRLLRAESDVQKFRATHNLQLSEGGVLIDTRQLEQLNEKLTEAKAELAESEAKYEQVDQLLKNGVDPEVIGDAINSATVSRLRAQYAIAARREAILGASLLPSHPEMLQARSEVARLRGLIQAEVERIAQAIKLENQAAKERLQAAQSDLATSRQEANTNDSAYIKLRELEREAETTRTVYESFLSRVKEMNEAEGVYTPDARIITPAAVPQKPSWPKGFLTLALALVVGCLVGGSSALATEYLDRRIYSESELLTSTGLKPLVSIPNLDVRRGLIGRLAGDQRPAGFYDLVVETLEGNPHYGFRSAIYRLLSYLMDFDTVGQPRVVLLTSSLPGEGKSALSLSLAVAAATNGIRTLLIDASTSNPALTKIFGANEPTDVELGDRVITDQRLGLSFLSLTGEGDGPNGWVNRHALAEKLKEVAGGYELALIDAGTLNVERNTSALMSISQAILFLSRASTTSQQTAAAAAADLLQMANGRRCAAVLTMARSE